MSKLEPLDGSLLPMLETMSRDWQICHFATGDREIIFADSHTLGVAHDPGGGEIGHARGGIAGDEVENAVRSGIAAGDEVAPGDRALRRSGCLQYREHTTLRQPRQIGEPSLLHQSPRDRGIHTVKSENDRFFSFASWSGAGGKRQTQRRGCGAG